MCINDKWEAAKGCEHHPFPNIGDIDIVVKEFYVNIFDAWFYELERFPGIYYGTHMFATLPDTPAEVIEEPEMMEA